MSGGQATLVHLTDTTYKDIASVVQANQANLATSTNRVERGRKRISSVAVMVSEPVWISGTEGNGRGRGWNVYRGKRRVRGNRSYSY